ncbi:preQ(0) biosynthesis protein QueC [Seinonella peptonophila]|uniref:7-cyano-7-deazaguanine synthase n=1 Tax=Seinonella peptonophila TaxID=112248 RepID=A0A1M4XIY9_9BACL|nr:7-cyano-7-deazaguanine synthase QueC [Seinonella peptonophila]SHE93514.1 preQ(0) biosynthesis protein QueC [Seinonella peptonophila]
MKAVVILSGGLDSTTCMGIAQKDGYQLYPLTFDYGQRHRIELEAAAAVAAHYHVSDQHQIASLDWLGVLGGSALTDQTMDVPSAGEEKGIPSTYVPARNLIFISLATAYAEVVGATAIYLGVSAVDFSGYPDCRPAFIEAVNQTLALATEVGVNDQKESIQVVTPLIHLSKKETIRQGIELEVPYHLTTSCYRGEAKACGKCDSCHLRLKGFAENGVRDPIPYHDSVSVNV